MKKIELKSYLKCVIVTILFSTLAGCGGGSSGGNGGNSSGPSAEATAVGTPNGTATTETIGAAGGTVSTPDGKITVTIPAGALAGDTEIGIQPISNTAQGGVGSGYRLTPEGQVFDQPVELTFTYEDADVEGSDALTLDVATQIEGGYWKWIEGPVVDEEAQTVTVTTTHFTDWVLAKPFTIEPFSAKVSGSQTVALKVVFCRSLEPEPDPNGGDELAYLGVTCDSSDAFPVSNWSVNGVAGGNGTVGTVSGNGPTATYKAPNEPPTPNTVTVSVDVNVKIVVNNQTYDKTVIISNITITGSEVSYDGNIKFESLFPDGTQVSGTATVTWTQFEDNGDVKRYLPTGTISGVITIPGCDPLNASLPILTSTPESPAETLVVYTEINGAFPKKYQFALLGDGDLTFTCEDESVTLPGGNFLNAAICPDVNQWPSYETEDELVVPEGSPWTCSAFGLTVTASWDFKLSDNLAPLN